MDFLKNLVEAIGGTFWRIVGIAAGLGLVLGLILVAIIVKACGP